MTYSDRPSLYVLTLYYKDAKKYAAQLSWVREKIAAISGGDVKPIVFAEQQVALAFTTKVVEEQIKLALRDFHGEDEMAYLLVRVSQVVETNLPAAAGEWIQRRL